MRREVLEFGHGQWISQVGDDPSFFAASSEEQARILGWANGCPVVNGLIEERGGEAMARRYGELNFRFRHIVELAGAQNPDLAEQLMQPVQREDPPGLYEDDSVPDSYNHEIAPMNTLVGHALPRLLVGRVAMLEGAVKQASSPEQLLAMVSEDLVKADMEPRDVLKIALSFGWLDEHRAFGQMRTVKVAMLSDAPVLWEHYVRLRRPEKTAEGIA